MRRAIAIALVGTIGLQLLAVLLIAGGWIGKSPRKPPPTSAIQPSSPESEAERPNLEPCAKCKIKEYLDKGWQIVGVEVSDPEEAVRLVKDLMATSYRLDITYYCDKRRGPWDDPALEAFLPWLQDPNNLRSGVSFRFGDSTSHQRGIKFGFPDPSVPVPEPDLRTRVQNALRSRCPFPRFVRRIQRLIERGASGSATSVRLAGESA